MIACARFGRLSRVKTSCMDIDTIHMYSARCRFHKSAQNSKQHGFARAVLPSKNHTRDHHVIQNDVLHINFFFPMVLLISFTDKICSIVDILPSKNINYKYISAK